MDLDGKDKKAYHLIVRDGKGDVIATARILNPGTSFPEVAIGRVVLTADSRGNGIGIELMERCVQFVFDEFGKGKEIKHKWKNVLKEITALHHFKVSIP